MGNLVDPTPGEEAMPPGHARGALVRVEEPLPGPAAALSSLPGVVRLAVGAGLHATQWGVRSSWRLSRRLVVALRDPHEAARLARELGTTVAAVSELGRAVAGGVPLPDAVRAALAEEERHPAGRAGPDAAALRAQGAELLDRSRDVWEEDAGPAGHPAYARILQDLAPDEARVLLFLARSGPQPSVDVRSGGPIGRVNSQLITGGLTMIGARAGCRWVDRMPAYLDNLHRLGLVWFSREQLPDPMDYQVLEAQPEVVGAVHSRRFTRVVRRSIRLTPFGEGFCAATLGAG